MRTFACPNHNRAAGRSLAGCPMCGGRGRIPRDAWACATGTLAPQGQTPIVTAAGGLVLCLSRVGPHLGVLVVDPDGHPLDLPEPAMLAPEQVATVQRLLASWQASR